MVHVLHDPLIFSEHRSEQNCIETSNIDVYSCSSNRVFPILVLDLAELDELD